MSWNLAPLAVRREKQVQDQGGPQGGPTGPGGWFLELPAVPCTSELQTPPLRPLQGLRARFAGSGPLLEQSGWVPGIAPYYPPGYTHPVYPPGTIPSPAPADVPARPPGTHHRGMHI